MRWRQRRFVELLVNLQVAALIFLYGCKGPWNHGIPLSSQQHGVVDKFGLSGTLAQPPW